jgi:predicted DNA-binding ribbon-helix-helix protein
MLTIQLDDDLEWTLNQLAEQERINPQQLIKKLIARYANTVPLEDEATELSSFQRFLLDSPEMSDEELQSIQGNREFSVA